MRSHDLCVAARHRSTPSPGPDPETTPSSSARTPTAVQAGYLVSDVTPTGSPEKLLGVAGTAPNCSLSPRPQASIAAAFNNVAVNASAVQ